MKTMSFGLTTVATLALFAAALDAGAPAAEKQKIERLIKHVAGLKDAVFIRNGTEYEAATAGKFLRRKWSSLGGEIKTVDDFITKAASMSSTSGKAYRVRFKDGSEKESGPYLREVLKKMQAP